MKKVGKPPARPKARRPAPKGWGKRYAKTTVQRTDTPYSQSSLTIGRKVPRNIAQAFKLLDVVKDHYVIRYSGCNAANLGEGYYKLWASNIAGLRDLPCKIFDLTSIINRTDGTLNAAAPGYEPKINPDGSIQFVSQSCVDAAGNVVNPGVWQYEDSGWAGAGVGDNVPGTKSILDWLDIRLRLYGHFTGQCKWSIQLVQFADHANAPEYQPTTPNASRTALWQHLVKPFTYSSIFTTASNQQGKMRVLRSWNYILQPGTNESNKQFRDVKYFLRMNRRQNYAWADADGLTSSDGVMTDDDFAVTSGTGRAVVTPRARIYLLIRASAQTPAAAFDKLSHPSMDMIVRAKHTFQYL